MSQILTTQTENFTTFSTPLYQNWSPFTDVQSGDTIRIIDLYYNLYYPSIIPNNNFILRIKDYTNTLYPLYSEFKTVVKKEDIPFSYDPTLNWVAESFSNGIIFNQDIALQIGMSSAISIDIASNMFFQVNTYKKNIVFYIYGKNSSNVWELIPERYVIEIQLRVENIILSVIPNPIKLFHYKNLPVISVNITILAPPTYVWEILAINPYLSNQNNNNLELSSTDTSVLITHLLPSNSYVARGTGPKTIQINVSAAYWNTLTMNLNVQKIIQVNEVVNNISQFREHILVNVIFLNDSNILFVSNESIFFNAVKLISEPTPVLVDVNSFSAFTIDSQPAWIIITYVDANSISIVPIPTLSMESGIYEGIITISNANETKIISVQYTLSGGVILPIDEIGINFTLDQHFIQLNSLFQNTYFEMYMKIKVYIRNTLYKEYELTTLIPLLNKNGKINIGKTIHRLMVDINFQDQPRFYKLANIELIIKEKQLNQVITTYNYNLNYIAGKTNKNISASREIGYLDIYEGTTRVFKNTMYPLNLFSKNKVLNLEFYKNGILEFGYTISTQFQINDSNFTFSYANPGDLLEIKLINGAETIIKKFICFPKPLQKYVLGYENDYKMMGILECTGEISMSSEYKYYTNVKYENLVETLDNVSNERQTKLIIHTGFLLKEEHQVIDAILRSPRCRLFTDDTLTSGIDLIPLSKDIDEMSTDQSLYSYKLEFLINRTHHEKVYSI